MSEVEVTYKVGTGLLQPGPGWRCCTPPYARAANAQRRLHDLRRPYSAASTPMPEALLHAAWRRTSASSKAIPARDGHTYTVIYPGRPADGAGPDFRDAVLLRDDGARVHGHVEVHVRSGDWHNHGHGIDSAYNGVVLHVALIENGPPVETSSGMRIPLLLLKREHLDRPGPVPGDERPGLPGGGRDFETSPVPLPFLDMAAAGDRWFKNRSHGCTLHVSSSGGDQALWESALETLGYPANKRGFRQVAAILDWETVTAALESQPSFTMADLFLWAGGFGPRPGGAPRLRGKPPEWRSRHGRPSNHPRARLLAAADWAERWHIAGGPAAAFVSAVEEAGKPNELLSLFTVEREHSRAASLGVARARDAVVNALLPSVHALASTTRRPHLAAHAKSLFDAHPLLQPNSITREASSILRARGVNGTPHTAREQQGLIHIYRIATVRQRADQQLPLL